MFSNSFNFTANRIHEDIQQVSCRFAFISLLHEHISEVISRRACRDKCMDVRYLSPAAQINLVKRWRKGCSGR